MAANKVYRMIGTTDEVTSCGCCGRTELKGTIVLQEIDSGAFVFFGSVCGSKALGWTEKVVKDEAKQADKDRKAARLAAERAHPLTAQIDAEMDACNAVVPRMPFSERKVHMYRWQQMSSQIKAELDAQFSIKG